MTWKPHTRQTNYQMTVCFVKHQCGLGRDDYFKSDLCNHKIKLI